MKKILITLCTLAALAIVSPAFAVDGPENEVAPVANGLSPENEVVAVANSPSSENQVVVDNSSPQVSPKNAVVTLQPSTHLAAPFPFGPQSLLGCGEKCVYGSACESGTCYVPPNCYTGFCSCEGE